jgi:hypothetical protein
VFVKAEKAIALSLLQALYLDMMYPFLGSVASHS